MVELFYHQVVVTYLSPTQNSSAPVLPGAEKKNSGNDFW